MARRIRRRPLPGIVSAPPQPQEAGDAMLFEGEGATSPYDGVPDMSPGASVAAARTAVAADMRQRREAVAMAMAQAQAEVSAAVEQAARALQGQRLPATEAEGFDVTHRLTDAAVTDGGQAMAAAMQAADTAVAAANNAMQAAETLAGAGSGGASRALGEAMSAADRSLAAGEQAASEAVADAALRANDVAGG